MFVFETTAHDHSKGVGTAVPVTRVDATDSVVFIFTNKRHVVLGHVHLLPVEENIGVEGTINFEASEVGLGGIEVKAEVLALTHAIDKLLSDEFSNISI